MDAETKDLCTALRDPEALYQNGAALADEAAELIETLCARLESPPKSWPSEPTEAMLQDGARAYEHHLDHARPGPHTQAEAMSAAWMAIMSHLSQPHKPGGKIIPGHRFCHNEMPGATMCQVCGADLPPSAGGEKSPKECGK